MHGFGRWRRAVQEAARAACLGGWSLAAAAAVAAAADEPARQVQPIRGLSGISPADAAVAAAGAEIGHARQSGDDDALVDALVIRAQALQAGNRLAQAGVDLAEARDLAARSGRSLRLARVAGAQAGLLLARGAHREALPLIEDSLAIARAHADAAVEAAALINLGNFYAHPAAQLTDRAIDAYTEAMRRSDAAGRPDLGARAALNLARAALIDRDRGYAALGWRSAMAQISQVAAATERAPLLLSAAELRRDLQDLLPDDAGARAADAMFHMAAADAEGAGMHPERARALGGLAAIADAAGDAGGALDLVVEARLLADAERDPDLAFDLALHEARLRARAGDHWGALAHYAAAIDLAAGISVDLAATDAADRASRFRERVAPAFSEYASLLLTASRSEPDPSRRQATLAAVRDVVERFKTAELTNYFQDPCFVAAADASAPSRPAPPRTAYIYPIPIAEEMTVLVSIGDALSADTVAVSADRLAQWAGQFRAATERAPRARSAAGHSAGTGMPEARRLYELLLQPIVARLEAAGVDTLVFVPDSRLRVLPWSALPDGESALGDRYAVAVVPGVWSTGVGPPARRAKVRPLICGLSVPTQGFSGLPNVDEEVRSIHALYGGTLLQDEQCRFDTMRAALAADEFSVLHIATHARFARSNAETFLLTYDAPVGMNDLERLIRPSRYRDQPVELVVLSACETAAGDDRAAIGLAGTALKAGARSVLATLWQVDDAASRDLVTAFYRHLADPAVSKAQALKRAQRDLRRNARTAHPYYWAGFVLIGSWM